MKRRVFLTAGLGLTVLGLTGCGGDTVDVPLVGPADPTFRRGAGGLVPPPEDLESYPLALDPNLLGVVPKVETPSAFRLPADTLPGVLDQGSLESCGAFACAYLVGSSVAAETNGGSLSEEDYQVSPAYAFRKALEELGIATAAQDVDGTYAKNYYNFLVARGNARRSAVPYPASGLSLEKEGAAIDAIKLETSLVLPRFQVGSWHYIADYQDVDLIKTFLVAGRPVSFLSTVYENYYDYKGGHFKGTSKTTGGHFQGIIGYDDSQDAFLVQNSWGTGWGVEGLCWYGYESFKNAVGEAHAVYPVQAVPADGTGGGTTVLADDSGGGAPSVSFPRVEQAQDSAGTVFLIFWHDFSEGLRMVRWEVTDPDGHGVQHEHGHFSRTGYYYLTRRDGKQFKAGDYRVRLVLENASGRRFRAEGLVHPVASLPGLEQGDLTHPTVGAHNRKPVVHVEP